MTTNYAVRSQDLWRRVIGVVRAFWTLGYIYRSKGVVRPTELQYAPEAIYMSRKSIDGMHDIVDIFIAGLVERRTAEEGHAFISRSSTSRKYKNKVKQDEVFVSWRLLARLRYVLEAAGLGHALVGHTVARCIVERFNEQRPLGKYVTAFVTPEGVVLRSFY